MAGKRSLTARSLPLAVAEQDRATEDPAKHPQGVQSRWRYWRQPGELTEGRHWTESALSMTGDASASLRARALQAAAAPAFPQGGYQWLTTAHLPITSRDNSLATRLAARLVGMVPGRRRIGSVGAVQRSRSFRACETA